MKIQLTIKIERAHQQEPIYVQLTDREVRQMGFQPNPERFEEED